MNSSTWISRTWISYSSALRMFHSKVASELIRKGSLHNLFAFCASLSRQAVMSISVAIRIEASTLIKGRLTQKSNFALYRMIRNNWYKKMSYLPHSTHLKFQLSWKSEKFQLLTLNPISYGISVPAVLWGGWNPPPLLKTHLGVLDSNFFFLYLKSYTQLAYPNNPNQISLTLLAYPH